MKMLILILLLIPFTTICQETPDCSKIRNTTVYAYPKNSPDHYKVVNQGDRHIEYNLKTGDSTIFQLSWGKDCSYILSFISTSEKKPAAEIETVKKFKLAYRISSITEAYYIYELYLDKINKTSGENRYLTLDTAWFSSKDSPGNNKQFEPLTEKPSYLKKHFRDTSSYAIVYLYRQGKFFAMLNEYFVYYDNELMYWARNKTKAAVKLYKTGPVLLTAKSGNTESKLNLDVQPGKKYYVECVIHHRVSRATPELKLVDAAEGQLNFETIPDQPDMETGK